MTIIGGEADFAHKVQRLKIYAPSSTNSDDLETEMGTHELHLSHRIFSSRFQVCSDLPSLS